MRSNHQEEWPVHVFRRTNIRGWERYIYSPPNPNHNGNSTSKHNPNDNDDPNTVMVTPRKGCVEVRQLRLRIHLFQSPSSNHHHHSTKTASSTTTTITKKNVAETSSGSGGGTYSNQKHSQQPQQLSQSKQLKEGNNHHNHGSNHNNNNPVKHQHQNKHNTKKEDTPPAANTVVIQRMDTILLSTRKGGAVVLKFRDKLDCNSFADKLVSLNVDSLPSLRGTSPYTTATAIANASATATASASASASTSRSPHLTFYGNPSLDCDLSEPIQKRRKFKNGIHMTSPPQFMLSSTTTTPNSNFPLSEVEERRKQDVFSYIVRLLHDESFLSFVDDIESTLASSPDCVGVWEALGIRR